jgi:hypothetical protein
MLAWDDQILWYEFIRRSAAVHLCIRLAVRKAFQSNKHDRPSSQKGPGSDLILGRYIKLGLTESGSVL